MLNISHNLRITYTNIECHEEFKKFTGNSGNSLFKNEKLITTDILVIVGIIVILVIAGLTRNLALCIKLRQIKICLGQGALFGLALLLLIMFIRSQRY
jgi:hypothetical protein